MGIIDGIANALGWLLDILFNGLYAIGLGNTAIAIIVFTIIIKLLMLPLSIKQQKSVKLNAIMSPELKAIQAKYKDKKGDQNAMMKQQEEMKAVYSKYGVSQMGGCIQMIIQMPILLALYRVFLYIPTYVGKLNDLLINVFNGISSQSGFADTMNNTFTIAGGVDWNNSEAAVRALNSFTSGQWDQLKELFPSMSQMIADNQNQVFHINNCFGINMSVAPSAVWGIAILIPVLATLSQYFSVKLSQANNSMTSGDDPMGASMKMMNVFMPLMSGFIAFTVPAGLGLYWTATAVIQVIIQLLINRHYDKIGVEEIVRRNREKAAAKRAKKGLPPEKIVKNANISTKAVQSKEDRYTTLKNKQAANEQKIKDIKASTDYYKSGDNTKKGSLAQKAGMVSQFNEKNNKHK